MVYTYENFSKEERFKNFSKAVQYCTLCYRMNNRKKILTNKNGNINSKVLFIAEAPGRFGADLTGIPLYGDKTGKNFDKILSSIKWNREEIFLTNAVLCNPRNLEGNNGKPTREEIKNCSNFLEMTINLVNPKVIVTLGNIALESLKFIHPHYISLIENVAFTYKWNNKIVFPLYHPGPRALIHRPINKQIDDYIKLAELVHPLKGLLVNDLYLINKLSLNKIDYNKKLNQIIFLILNLIRKTTFFKLTKLLYLIDLKALENIGSTITDEIYLRQKEGPWMPKLKDEIVKMHDYEIKSYFDNRIPILKLGPNPRFNIKLNEDILNIVFEIIEKYGNLNESSIKTKVYLTPPMKYIIKQEKYGREMYNKPLIYKNKTINEIDQY